MGLALPLSLILGTSSATAKPVGTSIDETPNLASTHPLFRLVASERSTTTYADATLRGAGVFAGTVPRPPAPPAPSALDCEHAVHTITLDPATGETTATMKLRVRANGAPLSSIGLMLDAGLDIGPITAPGYKVTVSEQIVTSTRVARLQISPAIPEGASTVLEVPYGGTLLCGGNTQAGAVVCSKGRDFSTFPQQSIFPYIYDPVEPNSKTLDAMTREIVLRVPASNDVIATGELVSETVEGATKISRWTIARPLSRILGVYVFAGKLGLLPVGGRSSPTTLVFPAPEQSVDQRLATWSAPVLDFVETTAGTPLPFQRTLSLVRLPEDLSDPGTATYGMTLLSGSYAKTGDLMHEETWAHENSHLFWGIVAPEINPLESRLMSEGIATLSELDYTRASHFADEDRDAYLARRFIPIGLDLQRFGKSLPPVVVPPGGTAPDPLATQSFTLWAYYKGAATLDHLRVSVGEDVFARGLKKYLERCSYVGCRPDALREVLEEAGGRHVAPFFERWVTGSSRPRVTVAFREEADGADVELGKEDELPMVLELWIRLEDGQLTKQLATLEGRTSKLHVTTPGRVRSVSASPRHDIMVDSVSIVPGDLDFDGESDGLDILRCVRLVGKHYSPETAVGLWNVDEQFDPRCDVNGDQRIDKSDLAFLTDSFGTLRASPRGPR